MIQGVLLAAGGSRRFGAGKLRHPLADGTPIGLAALTQLQTAMDACLCIVKPGDDTLARDFRAAGAAVSVCPDAASGMGASLAHAIRATADARGWVIALADMPWIHPATIAGVAEALRAGQPLAAPAYRGRRGHPVGFGRGFLDALSDLHGDAGARALLAAHAEQLMLLPGNDPGILQDIDEPADLRPALDGRRGDGEP